jgi:hypothetical protein
MIPLAPPLTLAIGRGLLFSSVYVYDCMKPERADAHKQNEKSQLAKKQKEQQKEQKKTKKKLFLLWLFMT